MFLLTNVRSLINKCDDLSLCLANDNILLAFITETWLKEDIYDSVIAIDGYSVIRCDRNYKKGGGVCVYYKSELNVEIKPLKCPIENIDFLCFKFNKLLFLLLYVPPNLKSSTHLELNEFLVSTIDTILQDNSYLSPIICGDLNDFKTNEVSNKICLKNIVTQCTRKTSTLDKFLVQKEQSQSYKIEIKSPISTSDHNVVIVKGMKPKIKKSKTIVYDYRKSKLKNSIDCLNNANWAKMYKNENLEEKIEILYEYLHSAVDKIPRKVTVLKSNDVPWMNPVLKSLISDRWAAYKAGNSSLYNHLKEKVKKEIHKAKEKWGKKLQGSKKNIWKIANNGKKNKSLEPLIKQYDNPLLLAEEINKMFVSNFTTPFTFPPVSFAKINDPVDEIEAFAFLENINTAKSYSNEGLPSKFIKLSSHILAKPLANIATMCLEKGSFPSKWKKSTVVSIPKSKEISLANLRPISLRPILSIFLEQLILKRIEPFISKKINNDQFGFRQKCSTTHAHIKILDTTTKLLENKNVSAVSIVCFDLQKAFDKVSHEILWNKLCTILPDRLLQLVSSVLSNRTQQVKIESSYSSFLSVTSGVPQGCLLSPLLFTFFMNDLTPMHNTEVVKYADDTTFIVPHFVNDISDRVVYLQNHMQHWCNSNSLKLNQSKTKIMTIKKKNFQNYLSLPRVPTLRILGLIFNDNLGWNQHIEKIVKRCSSQLFLLRKIKGTLNSKSLLTIYYGLIECLQSYSGAAFLHLPQYLENQLNSITKRAHRIICHKECNCEILKLPINRRKEMALKLLSQMNDPQHILHSLMPKTHKYCQKYVAEKCLTSRRHVQFLPQVIMLSNSVF